MILDPNSEAGQIIEALCGERERLRADLARVTAERDETLLRAERAEAEVERLRPIAELARLYLDLDDQIDALPDDEAAIDRAAHAAHAARIRLAGALAAVRRPTAAQTNDDA